MGQYQNKIFLTLQFTPFTLTHSFCRDEVVAIVICNMSYDFDSNKFWFFISSNMIIISKLLCLPDDLFHVYNNFQNKLNPCSTLLLYDIDMDVFLFNIRKLHLKWVHCGVYSKTCNVMQSC